jgi:hypothetical protein
MNEKQELVYRPDWNWAGRSLSNYIAMHPKAKGASTLTEARKMAFGVKQKRFTCCRDKCSQCK